MHSQYITEENYHIGNVRLENNIYGDLGCYAENNHIGNPNIKI